MDLQKDVGTGNHGNRKLPERVHPRSIWIILVLILVGLAFGWARGETKAGVVTGLHHLRELPSA